ncbi:MAG: AAA family ATPase [Elusimicrobiota bacterium]|jgi:transitional endoplasmic reticulum ATPase|nr:AAA family ATPase [Elusimicrobiota bacterium]
MPTTKILPKDFLIDNKYKVMFFVKEGNNAQTYRIKDKEEKICFLKLFDYSKLNFFSFDNQNNLLEIKFLKNISHENIVSYKDSGELFYDNKKFGYLILDFISGETLFEKIGREPFCVYYDIKRIINDVLRGLDYLHSLPEPIIHNEITPQNIMLDLSTNPPKAKIIDFGYARSWYQSTKAYNKSGLNFHYVANECFNNLYSPQSDIFSIGAVMYQLIFGLPPWFKQLSKFQSERISLEETIVSERNRPLSFFSLPERFIGFNDNVKLILKKALDVNLDNRFKTAKEFMQALKEEIKIEDLPSSYKNEPTKNNNKPTAINTSSKPTGFDAITGMKELKAQLKFDVIDALKNPQEYAKYGVTIPNGMLLYGPPGCGKTFFAKHFAQEAGFNFILATPSTLQSRYINATKENVAKMFKEAEQNAPIVIFIDEIDVLLANRAKAFGDGSIMFNEAINEMLAQMDRTGEKGIFIVGATNYPDIIDPAMLRTGRLDKKVYIPPPDFETRKMMFERYLKDRPLERDIDYEQLSKLTENYVSSDIEFLVNEASKPALKLKTKITMSHLEEAIKNTKPSVSLGALKSFEKIKQRMEGKNEQKTKNTIGFNQ